MARPLRLEFPGAVYHVTARGDRKEVIFADDADREQFLYLLGREIEQQSWILYAYCLMGNHYHLLLETPEANLSRGMRRLNGAYTQQFNRRHGLVGHVLQGRYKAILVDRDAYLLELCRYTVLNPVRANLARDPDQWPWSSYSATRGLSAAPSWLAKGAVLALFHHDPATAQQTYERFVAQGIGRTSPWSQVVGQIYLGAETFLQRMHQMAENSPPADVPVTQRYPARPSRKQILDAVAAEYLVKPSQIWRGSSNPAFSAAVYLLRKVGNLPLREVAALARISPSWVSEICSKIERAEPNATMTITRLEKILWKTKN